MENANKYVPFADEASMAQLAYDRWARAQAENMAEFIYRRRTVDLAILLRQAIDEELNDNQRKMIRMRYYENKTPTQIARLTGLHLSTVQRTLKLAEETLQKRLKYVVEYQHNLTEVPILPLVVREAMVVSAARHTVAHAFPERLHTLRVGENLSADAVADAAEIPPERYALLESGEKEANAGELLRLSAFFNVSVDSLLKGGAA